MCQHFTFQFRWIFKNSSVGLEIDRWQVQDFVVNQYSIILRVILNVKMAPLHRSLSFQISEAFNEMWNRKSSKYKKYGYYDNGGEIGENENVQYLFNYNYSLTKSISCDFQKRGKFRHHSSYNTINRTNTLPKRFGEINFHVSLFIFDRILISLVLKFVIQIWKFYQQI